MAGPITMWSEALTFTAVGAGAPGPTGPTGPAGPVYGLRCNVSTIVRGLSTPLSPASLEFTALKNNSDGTQSTISCGPNYNIELTQSEVDNTSTSFVDIDSSLIGYGSGETSSSYTTKTLNLNYSGRDYSRDGANNGVTAIRAQLKQGSIVIVELAIPFTMSDELIDLGSVDENGRVVIGDGKVTANAIAANAVTAGKIAAGTISANHLTGNQLDSISPAPAFPANSDGTTDSSHFTTAGARVNLGNGGSIHFQNFYIDTSGNVRVRGTIDALNGAITGKLGIGEAINNEYPIYVDGSKNADYSLKIRDNFSVTPAGAMTAKAGTVGGWILSENGLASRNGTAGVYSGESLLASTSMPYRFYAGSNSSSPAFFVDANGYLYAQNAMVAGEINATGGDISGSVTVGDGILIDGKQGTIQSLPFVSGAQGWQITKEGNAEFNNATVRGKLSSVIFETSTTNAVGGDLYIAPSVTIPKSQITLSSNSSSYILTIENDNTVLNDAWNGIEGLMNLTVQLASGANQTYNNVHGTVIYNTSNNTATITIAISELNGAAISSIINDVVLLNIGTTTARKYIRLTADATNSPYIDVQDYNIADTSILPRVRIGRLDGITDSVNDFGTLEGYGLYCNRAYLTGELNLPSAGVTNQASIGYNGTSYVPSSEASPVRIWAGGSKPKVGENTASFIVTQDGSLYATKGVFEGQVIATNSEFSGTIRAAGILIDKGGDGYTPAVADNHFFVGYQEKPTSFDDYVLDINSAGLSVWEGGLKVYSDTLSGWLNDTKTEANALLPYGYTATNTKPYPYIAAIDAGRLMTREWHNLSIDTDYNAYSIGAKNGKIYFGYTTSEEEDRENYLAYEAAQYEKLDEYGYLGTDASQNLTLSSTKDLDLNGNVVNISATQVAIANPTGKAEISMAGAIMRQVVDTDNNTIGLDFIFE